MSGSVLVVTHTSPVDAGGTASPTRGRKTLLRRFVNFLFGVLSGAKKASSYDIWTDGSTPVAASGTITLASCPANTVIDIHGVPFTAVNGAATTGNNEFDISGDDTADAASLVTAINASSLSSYLVATSALGVVTLTALQKSAYGNALTMKTLGEIAFGTVTYVTPSGAQSVTINGVAVSFTVGATATATATAAAAAVNASANALVSGHVRALSRAGVLWLLAKYDGARGNAITLSASGTGSTASGARLTSGAVGSEGVQASGTVTISGADGGTYATTINGVTINATGTNGNDTATAASIVVAINTSTDALVGGWVRASSSSGVVTITASRGGVGGNAITLSVTGTGATASGVRLTGGAVIPTEVMSGDRLASGAGGSGSPISVTL